MDASDIREVLCPCVPLIIVLAIGASWVIAHHWPRAVLTFVLVSISASALILMLLIPIIGAWKSENDLSLKNGLRPIGEVSWMSFRFPSPNGTKILVRAGVGLAAVGILAAAGFGLSAMTKMRWIKDSKLIHDLFVVRVDNSHRSAKLFKARCKA